ncbi:MAG: hypothetical protein IT195_01770 [Microthrixaceae bacterium]|nr:hypothetical protein [Microthrixaceae bacterium]
MGWNSWNQVRCHDLTEDIVKRADDAIARLGLDKVGYEYVVVDGKLSADEVRSHVGMWAMLAAPLMIGTDMDRLAPKVLEAISNEEIIAIDQDPLGKQARRIKVGEGRFWDRTEVWARPIEGGDYAVALLNTTGSHVEIVTTLEDVGAGSSRRSPPDPCAQTRPIRQLGKGQTTHRGETWGSDCEGAGSTRLRVERGEPFADSRDEEHTVIAAHVTEPGRWNRDDATVTSCDRHKEEVQ